jgi:hypothetical protein
MLDSFVRPEGRPGGPQGLERCVWTQGQRTGLTALMQVDCSADFQYLSGMHAALTSPLLPARRDMAHAQDVSTTAL